jgi:hypothetical protein
LVDNLLLLFSDDKFGRSKTDGGDKISGAK